MAQRVEIVLEDDIDNGPADRTVTFALDGVEYEIDLSDENAEKLHSDLALWISHARRVGGRRRRQTTRQAASSKSDSSASPAEIRAWAAENGMEVSSRGRVPDNVREAYERANS
ncbi:Lsr2 family protein [Desertihabitans brevis]|uniref:Lsr2 family protein n=1 Tax=Desertihabitans brevis TaxID=2268447 RepID=A0A367YTG3_9ACTN|nr:Lsr2 family protein [Desertihabitans brevis]RCK69185.1 Lsr2 family protein [Desertihabitans brevis]